MLRRGFLGLCDPGQFEALIVVPLVEFPAAGEACGGPAKRSDTFNFRLTVWTAVDVGAWQFTARQGQVVAAGLIRKTQFYAGFPPFRTMWGDAASTGSVACHQMGEFVEERALHLAPSE